MKFDIIVWNGMDLIGLAVWGAVISGVILLALILKVASWVDKLSKKKKQCYYCRKKFDVSRKVGKNEEFICRDCLKDQPPRCSVCKGDDGCPVFGCSNI